jgi:hypothetical protein
MTFRANFVCLPASVHGANNNTSRGPINKCTTNRFLSSDIEQNLAFENNSKAWINEAVDPMLLPKKPRFRY